MTADAGNTTERPAPVRSWHIRAAAWILAAVFLCLPTISRVHDRVSRDDRAAGFRLSKNLERPHEKFASPTSLVAVVATAIDWKSRPTESVAIVCVSRPLLPGFSKLVSARAPPLA